MQSLTGRLRRLWAEQEGQSLAEYGTIVALIAIACLALLTTLYGQVAYFFGEIVSALSRVVPGS